MWNLIRDGIDDLSYKAEIETQTERTNMQIPRGNGGWAELEYWEDTHALLMSTHLLSCSAVSNSLQPCGLWSARLLCAWAFPGKNIGAGCHFLR